LDAHADEQRRNQAEARVPFLLVTYSLGKQRKATRLQAKRNVQIFQKYRLKPPEISTFVPYFKEN
jgi:hypothetical protein